MYGCISLPQRTLSEDVSLEVATLLKFDDVPVPAGLKFIPEDSFAFQNDLFRVALLRYSGRVAAEQAVSFYKEQMPLYGWEVINIVEYGTKTLNFDRPEETCTIIINAKGSKKSDIAISVAPKAASRRSKK